MKLNQDKIQTGQSTYSPQDNKLRLYVGRVPREEFQALRAEGWKSTPKQSEAGQGEFAATWTPEREDTALAYGCGYIGDEDTGPEERAADRAERFAGYRDKRTAEALGHADRYDAGPSTFGHQDKGRAARAADRHDRIAGRAVRQWDKAEYWTRRTAGVISNALHLGSPSVRLGRIKKLESEQRKSAKSLEEYKLKFSKVRQLADFQNPERFKKWKAEHGDDLESWAGLAITVFGRLISSGYGYKHPRPEVVKSDYIREDGLNIYGLLTLEEDEGEPITAAEACELWLAGRADPESEEFQETNFARWASHYANRLAYENSMIEAEGGAAGEVEVKVGDLIDGHAVVKVNKSNASGKVTSVDVICMPGGAASLRPRWKGGNLIYPEAGDIAHIKLDRALSDCHAPATDESLQAVEDYKAKLKAEKKAAPKKPKLINPTLEAAKRVQEAMNKRAKEKARASGCKDLEPVEMTQKEYSANSGTYGNCETAEFGERLLERCLNYAGHDHNHQRDTRFKLRIYKGGGFYEAHQVVILTDKPQKPIPFDEIEAAAEAEAEAEARALAEERKEFESPEGMSKLVEAMRAFSGMGSPNADQLDLVDRAVSAKLVHSTSYTQKSWTKEGAELRDSVMPTANA